MGFLYFVSVHDVSEEHLRPGFLVCLAEVEVVRVFLPPRCDDAVMSVDGGVVLTSFAIVPCAFDVPACGIDCGAAYDRG